MSNEVKFEEENSFKSHRIFGDPVKPKMVDFLIKSGLARDSKSAGSILIILAVVFLVVSVLIYLVFISSTPKHVQDPLYNLTPEQKSQIPADELKVMQNPKWK